MWDFIINPFITILTVLYAIFGNDIVVAIAIFTVIVRLLTAPLILQQQKSTQAMQELQPELERLKEKYKADREKLAQAQMALYRERGINPLGGCFPLLVQLPIILGLYGAIIIALGATPFQVIDLSGRLLVPGLDSVIPLDKIWLGMDITQPPTNIMDSAPLVLLMPVLVMVTTWLQTKLTFIPPPPSADGKENPTMQMTRSMTTMLPILYGFFALSFSVGLSIYFIISNVVGIIQYTLMGKAHWGVLLGREVQTDAQKQAQRQASDELIEKIVNTVEGKQGKSTLATESVLTARPAPPKAVAGGSGTGTGGNPPRKKTKKRRK